MPLNTIEEVIDDIRRGRMVIIMDDEDRENEGDLVMAASMVRPEDVNFMARYGRGLICLTLTRERCRQLNLPLMVSSTDASHRTNFTVSIEAAEGVTTGISAYDRAHTVRTAVAGDARAADITQPGHIFPLMAQPGGVLTRAGHTEAGCDLSRLAGLEPAAVIVEILNEDGTMARRPDLEIFAAEHGLKIGTIADLISYRLQNEKTVERVAAAPWTTESGAFRLLAYHDWVGKGLHYALVKGRPEPRSPTLVRVHVQDTLCDLLGAADQQCGWPLRDALGRVAEEETGVVIVLQYPQSPEAIIHRLHGAGAPGRAQEDSQAATNELRTLGVGAQILADCGVGKMRVLGAPRVMHGLGGFGLEVVEYIES
jgi:3,4-dihydroxy 2-butanone 4-phosphate synthase/GTP cyclohydrolase II